MPIKTTNMHVINYSVFSVLCVIGSIHLVTAQGTLPTTVPPTPPTSSSTTLSSCPDISPCIYENNDCTAGGINIECNAPMEEVKTAFNSLTTPIQMFSIVLYVQFPGDTIPADILGRSLTTSFLLIIGSDNFPSVSVDPDAFRSSRFTVEYVEFQKLDMTQVDFQFLAGCTQVYMLSLLAISNLQHSLPTIPALPGLSIIQIYLATGLNQEWQNGSVFLPNGLEYFYAVQCGLNDEGMGQLLDWLIPNSAVTLRNLLINGNRISSIPRQIRSFQQLSVIDIIGNRVELTVPSNSFNGTTNKRIDLTESLVVRVEPDSFIGNYNSTKVILNDNLLTRFEEGVFKAMLQDMPGIIDGFSGGTLDINPNPLDCFSDPCHLAWLLRDNRNLLKGFYSPPQCADGTAFEDLSPNLFKNCP